MKNAASIYLPMAWRVPVVVICFVLAAAPLAWFLFGMDRDVRAVNRNLTRILDAIEKTEPESTIAAAASARDAARYFTPEASVDAGNGLPMLRGRDEILGALVQLRGRSERVSFRVLESKVETPGDGGQADQDLTLEIRVVHQDETGEDVRRFRIEWEKADRHWLVSRVDFLE